MKSKQSIFTAALICLLGVLAMPVRLAAQGGTFSVTGSMNSLRTVQTATLLPNGTVLVAGGFAPGVTTFSTAELYDPDTGLFSPTGSMATARRAHTATLLPNGKVLVAGGRFPPDYFASAELYDPDTGLFSPTGSMGTPRAFHTATLLANGKVLVAGGLSAGTDVASAELYDPDTGVFSATGSMTAVRQDHTATLLSNNSVLITGGDSGNTSFASAELYNPDTGVFSTTGAMSTARAVHTATLLPASTTRPHGKVLVAGGFSSSAVFATAELYDPDAGTFSPTGSMSIARSDQSATLLPAWTLRPHGKVLIAGGVGNGPAFASAELYDPDTGLFSPTGNLNNDRRDHTATLLPNGAVLITGGSATTAATASAAAVSGAIGSADLYNPPSSVPAPVLSSLSGDGRGQGAIQHADTYQVASPGNPAAAGDILAIYFTGLIDGSGISPQVAIGGHAAEVLFFGSAPGYPGLDQVNVRMPAGVAPGPAVPVRLVYCGRTSNQVTIGAR